MGHPKGERFGRPPGQHDEAAYGPENVVQQAAAIDRFRPGLDRRQRQKFPQVLIELGRAGRLDQSGDRGLQQRLVVVWSGQVRRVGRIGRGRQCRRELAGGCGIRVPFFGF
jgi:hypothetical protein